MNVENWFMAPMEIEKPKPGQQKEISEDFARYFRPVPCHGDPGARFSTSDVNIRRATAPPLPTEVRIEPFEGLSHGQKGADVKRVQKVLGKWNSALGVKATGVYDRKTRDALTLYKAIYGGEGGGAEIDGTTAKYLRQMEEGTFWEAPPVKTAQQEMLYHASRHLGKPYVLGGDGVRSTDCGMLTSQAMKQSGVGSFSRLADMQYRSARRGEQGLNFHNSEPVAGDLIFFRVPTRQSSIAYDGVTHVTMYVGDGLTLAASSGAGKVILQPLEQLDHYVAGFGRVKEQQLASAD